MCSFLHSLFSSCLLLCVVSRLPAVSDRQPSSSCFLPVSVCPPPISPSGWSIYAGLLQLLRHTSWLLPGEADWLLSHSRALPASGLTPADWRWHGAEYRWPLRVDSPVIRQLGAFLLDLCLRVCVYVCFRATVVTSRCHMAYFPLTFDLNLASMLKLFTENRCLTPILLMFELKERSTTWCMFSWSLFVQMCCSQSFSPGVFSLPYSFCSLWPSFYLLLGHGPGKEGRDVWDHVCCTLQRQEAVIRVEKGLNALFTPSPGPLFQD